MKVEQISIFLENKSGRLAEVTDVLAKAQVNIRALSVADTADFGILRLIVSNVEKAKQVLKDHGFTLAKTEVVAIKVADRPGGVASVLKALEGENINVEYMYAFIQKSREDAIIIFRFDDIDRAIEVLKSGGIEILKGEEIYAL